MTISSVACGSVATSAFANTTTDTLTVTAPEGIQNTDMMLLYVAGRGRIGASMAAGCLVPAPSGWTQVMTGTGDSSLNDWGSTVDTGNLRWYVFKKQADGTESSTTTDVTFNDAHLGVGYIAVFRKSNSNATWNLLDGSALDNATQVSAPSTVTSTANYVPTSPVLDWWDSNYGLLFKAGPSNTFTGTSPDYRYYQFNWNSVGGSGTEIVEWRTSLGSHLSGFLQGRVIAGGGIASSFTCTYRDLGSDWSANNTNVQVGTLILREEVVISASLPTPQRTGDPVTNDYADSYSVSGQIGANYSDSYFIRVRKSDGKGRAVKDAVNAVWYPSTGADLWDMVDETEASDADYIYSQARNSVCELVLDALVPPAGGTTHTVRIRARTTTGHNVRVTLKQGASTTVATRDITLTSTQTTYTFTLTAPEIALITDYDTLRVRLQSL